MAIDLLNCSSCNTVVDVSGTGFAREGIACFDCPYSNAYCLDCAKKSMTSCDCGCEYCFDCVEEEGECIECEEELTKPNKKISEFVQPFLKKVDRFFSNIFTEDAETLDEFMEWARDKITVVWSFGSLCNSEPLEYFGPKSGESVETFLNRVVTWVDKHESVKEKCDEADKWIFNFYDDSLGEEWDEYQEETYNVKELMSIWKKTRDF